MAQNPIVTIEMEDGSIMKAELYPEIAPNTVNNFISLIQKGFYDGVIFHRVIEGFMLQGGDPQGTGMGGPDYSIKGEFTQNGFENNLAHDPGVLSMARTMAPDSAGSQFFIMHKKNHVMDYHDTASYNFSINSISYVGIIRIRYKGRNSQFPLRPFTASPI